MATFRKVHVSFWSDPYVQGLTPEQKYFFLYLLTNEKTKQCGIYEITKKQISHDTGYNQETIVILLEYFAKDGKIRYNSATNEIAVRNWEKYNGSRSPSVQSLVLEELASVKDRLLIEYIQSATTIHAIEEEEEENKKKNKKENKKVGEDSMLNFYFLEDFKPIWKKWIEYKATEHKDRYKTIETEQLALDKLIRISEKNSKIAEQIVNESRENRWKGLFPLKPNNYAVNQRTPISKPVPQGNIPRNGFGKL